MTAVRAGAGGGARGGRPRRPAAEPLRTAATAARDDLAALRASRQASAGAVVSLPMARHHPLPWYDADYEWYATRHWQPIANGYSRFEPPGYADLATHLAGFPGREALDAMCALQVRYVVVHARRPVADLRAAIAAAGEVTRLRRISARRRRRAVRARVPELTEPATPCAPRPWRRRAGRLAVTSCACVGPRRSRAAPCPSSRTHGVWSASAWRDRPAPRSSGTPPPISTGITATLTSSTSPAASRLLKRSPPPNNEMSLPGFARRSATVATASSLSVAPGQSSGRNVREHTMFRIPWQTYQRRPSRASPRTSCGRSGTCRTGPSAPRSRCRDPSRSSRTRRWVRR